MHFNVFAYPTDSAAFRVFYDYILFEVFFLASMFEQKMNDQIDGHKNNEITK